MIIDSLYVNENNNPARIYIEVFYEGYGSRKFIELKVMVLVYMPRK